MFTGSLTKIYRKVIKVEEEKLYITYISRVLLKPRKGYEIIIINIFLVPSLKINLLFGKRLTKSGLKKKFDFYSIYIVSYKEKVILKAFIKYKIYVVNWVLKYINKIAALNIFILLYLPKNPIKTIL